MADEMNKLNVRAGFTVTDEASGLAEINKIIKSITTSSKNLAKNLKTVEDALAMLTKDYKTSNSNIVVQSKKTKAQLQEDARQATATTKSELKIREKEYERSSAVIRSELRKGEVTHRETEKRKTAEYRNQLKIREKAYKDASKQSANSLKALEKAFNPDSLKSASNYLNYFKRNLAQTALTVTGVRTVLNEFAQVSGKVVEVEKNLINIKRIMQTTSEDTARALMESAVQAAKSTATQVTDAQKIQSAWVRINDLYASNTNLLSDITVLTSKFMNVAQIEEAEEAVKLLNATMLQFELTTSNAAKTMSNAQEVLNKWSYMADKTAMGTADEYGEGMSRFGGQLKNLKGDVDDAIVLMSILSDKLAKTGEEAGTSLKTFTAYLTRTKTTNLFDRIAEDLGDTSYSLVDANGKFKDFKDLMDSVSRAYEHYVSVGNDVMARDILESVGATRQRDTAVAILESWNAATNGAQKYYDMVESASVGGYMDKQNEALLESFAAKWEQVKTSMVETGYAIANAGLFDALSGLMTIMQKVLGVISNANPIILSTAVAITEMAVGFKLLKKTLSFTKAYKEYITLTKYGTKAQRDYALTLAHQVKSHIDLAAAESGTKASHIAAHLQLDKLNKEYLEGILTVDEYKDALLRLNAEEALGITIDAEGNIIAKDKNRITIESTALTQKDTLATILHKVATKEMTVADAAHLAVQEAKAAITGLLTSRTGQLILGVTAAIVAYKAWTAWQDRHNKALEESYEKYKESDDALSTYKQELDSLKQKLEELQQLSDSGKISVVEQEELERLQKELPLMEQKLRILEEQARIAKEQAARDFVNSATTRDNNHTKTDSNGYLYNVKLNDIELLQEYNKEIEELSSKYAELSEKSKDTTLSMREQKYLNEMAEETKQKLEETTNSASELAISLIDYVHQFSDITDKEVAGIEDVKSSIEGAVNETDALISETSTTVTGIETEVEDTETALEELQYTFSSLSFNNIAEGINNVTSSVQGLVDVQEKLAKGTALSNLELMELAQKYPELLTQANLFADGTVEGQRAAINAVLGMKQEEFNSSIDQKIAELDAENELINAQLELEAQRLDALAQAEGLLNEGRIQEAEDVANVISQLRADEASNFIIAKDGELAANQEAMSELLSQTDEFGLGATQIYNEAGQNLGDAMAQGASNGTTAQATNLSIMDRNYDAFNRTSVQPLAVEVSDAFAGNDNGGSVGGGSYQRGSNDGGTVNTGYSGSSGITRHSVQTKINGLKQAIADFKSSLQSQLNANITVKANLEKYKDIGVTSVSGGGSGGSGGGSSSSSSSKTGSKDKYGNDTSSTAYRDAVSAIEKLQDQIVAALKKKYQELYDARVDLLEKEKDKLIKVHNDRIEQLQEEIAILEGNRTEDKEANLSELERQYGLWKQDNSTLGKSKQKELYDQIEELSKEIKIDKLEQQISEEEMAIQQIEDHFEALFDADSPLYDPELKHISKLMSDQNLYAEANAMLQEQQTDEIIELLTKYGEKDYYSGIASLMGEEAGGIIAKEVKTALSQLASLLGGTLKDDKPSDNNTNNNSSTGGSGSSSGGGGGGTEKPKKWRFRLTKRDGSFYYSGYDYDSSTDALKHAKAAATTRDGKGYLYVQGSERAFYTTKYAKGGIVPNGHSLLDLIAKSLGEDTMIAAKAGERVLSPAQTKAFDSLVYDFLPSLSNGFKSGSSINNNTTTFNKELVSVRVDKVINNTPYDVKNGQDNLDRMFRTSLKKAGMNIGT